MNTAKPHRITWKTANCIEVPENFQITQTVWFRKTAILQLKIKFSAKPHHCKPLHQGARYERLDCIYLQAPVFLIPQ